MKANKGELEPDMIEESTKYDGESAEMVSKFKGHLEDGTNAYLKKNGVGKIPEEQFVNVVIDAIWRTYRADFWYLTVLAVFAEGIAAFSSFYIGYIIAFIGDKSIPTSVGLTRIAIFVACNAVSIIVRHNYTQGGMDVSVFLRRTLVAAMFDKILNLSLKSLVET